MKYIKRTVLAIYIVCCIWMLSCKKDNTNTNNDNAPSSDLPQKISTSLNGNDSLTQFAGIFKLVAVSTTDVAGGATVLALTNYAMTSPADPDKLKDYVVKGIVSVPELKNGKILTSITGKQILITEQNGKVYANGSMISVTPVATTPEYVVFPIASPYVTAPNSYDDPHKNEYYIEYYDNGAFHSLNSGYVSSWQFFNFSSYPVMVHSTCVPTYQQYSSGPVLSYANFYFPYPFTFQINRRDFSSKPIVGLYQISRASEDTLFHTGNKGNCDLIIDGARYGCDLGDKDSYIKINVTEVKVDQDLGLEKRGYYKGEFNAILYFAPAFGVYQKRVITGGRFMLPMGNNTNSSLNGTAPPVLDRFATLTTGKWSLRLYADPTEPCMLDDYLVFRPNGTFDCVDGGVQCDMGGFDYCTNVPWVFKNNQTVLNFSWGDALDYDWPIISMTNDTLNLSGLKLIHEK
jgi:hypothetical protein